MELDIYTILIKRSEHRTSKVCLFNIVWHFIVFNSIGYHTFHKNTEKKTLASYELKDGKLIKLKHITFDARRQKRKQRRQQFIWWMRHLFGVDRYHCRNNIYLGLLLILQMKAKQKISGSSNFRTHKHARGGDLKSEISLIALKSDKSIIFNLSSLEGEFDWNKCFAALVTSIEDFYTYKQ